MCMRSVRTVLLLLLLPAAALAQIQSGSIVVKTTDEQGAIVPGATLTVSSPVLPAEVSGVTDASGVFQIPGLTPGTYTVKVALQGFQTVIREDIVVRQGQAANVDFAMKVGALTEAVTVRGESPVVDTKSVGSRINIDSALLETTPGGKRHLEHHRIQGAGRGRRVAGRRRQPGRPPALDVGARNAERRRTPSS